MKFRTKKLKEISDNYEANINTEKLVEKIKKEDTIEKEDDVDTALNNIQNNEKKIGLVGRIRSYFITDARPNKLQVEKEISKQTTYNKLELEKAIQHYNKTDKKLEEARKNFDEATAAFKFFEYMSNSSLQEEANMKSYLKELEAKLEAEPDNGKLVNELSEFRTEMTLFQRDKKDVEKYQEKAAEYVVDYTNKAISLAAKLAKAEAAIKSYKKEDVKLRLLLSQTQTEKDSGFNYSRIAKGIQRTRELNKKCGELQGDEEDVVTENLNTLLNAQTEEIEDNSVVNSDSYKKIEHQNRRYSSTIVNLARSIIDGGSHGGGEED